MIDVDLNQVSIPLQWPQLFGKDVPTDIEIGSGKGKFLNEFAADRPERNLLGIERAAKYHSLCCQRAARRGLTNVRLLRTTAEDLLFRLLREGSVATFFVLFPDPWPKKRHHKRRLFKPEVVSTMTQMLAPGGRLLVKSDHEEYAAVINQALCSQPGLENLDTEEAFAGLPLTGFEQKYIVEGRPIHAFAFKKHVLSQR